MNLEIKKKFYDILTSNLGYTVCDTPVESRVRFPIVRLRLGNITRDTFQGNFMYCYSYYIDIFSNYNGEKEILLMEEAIYNEMQHLYEVDGVTYAREESFKIMDDKSLGPVRKHGIIKYTVYSNGAIKEE